MRGAVALAVTLVETIGEPTLLLAFVALPIKLETGPIAGKYEIGGCFGLRRDVHTLTGHARPDLRGERRHELPPRVLKLAVGPTGRVRRPHRHPYLALTGAFAVEVSILPQGPEYDFVEPEIGCPAE